MHFAAKAMTAQRTGRLLVISNRFRGGRRWKCIGCAGVSNRFSPSSKAGD
jgi:hypothetical protein